MWAKGIEILLKVLGISHILDFNMRVRVRGAVRVASARGRAAAAHGQTGSSWVGLIRGGCFLSATSQYPLPNPHHRKKKVSEQAKSRKNDPNAAVESYVSSQTISGSNFGPNKPKKLQTALSKQIPLK